MLSELNETIRQELHQAQKILIISHIRPDGDAIGSMLGLGLALEAVGKQVEMVLMDGVLANFRFLEGVEKIHRKPTLVYDFLIVVDVSDINRMGEAFIQLKPDLVIDHHVTNLNFGRINFVLPAAAATCAILAEFLPIWGLEINQQVAEALLTGILTDTNGFRTSNMTAETLRLAAALMERGADLPDLYFRGLVRRSFEAAVYWGCGLQKLERKGRMAWTTLTLQDREKAGYPGSDDADLTTVLSSIEECDISVLFIETKNGKVKVSWRANNGFDISQLALAFGGGGHKAAAGAEIVGKLVDVREKVLAATYGLL